ncbi:hypothetical protein D9M72_631460 [compost metagenome]
MGVHDLVGGRLRFGAVDRLLRVQLGHVGKDEPGHVQDLFRALFLGNQAFAGECDSGHVGLLQAGDQRLLIVVEVSCGNAQG